MSIEKIGDHPGATFGDQLSSAIAALPSWGGVCDGRDMTAEYYNINGLLNEKPGVTILLPAGMIRVFGPIENRAADSCAMIGLGQQWAPTSGPNGGTVFRWHGPDDVPLFRTRGSAFCRLEGFGVKSATPLKTGIQFETLTGRTSTANRVARVNMDGVNGLDKGIRWCAGSASGLPDGAGSDANNDLSFIEQVEVKHYGKAFSIEGTQSKTHTFIHSSFVFGQVGVESTGSFSWYGGAGGGNNTVADFRAAPADRLLISGANLEGSNRLFESMGASSNLHAVAIEHVRWAANALAADDLVVNYQHRGPLTISGCAIDGPTAGRNPKFMLTSSGQTVGSAIGNSIMWTDPVDGCQPFITTYGRGLWFSRSNIVKGPDQDDVFIVPNLG